VDKAQIGTAITDPNSTISSWQKPTVCIVKGRSTIPNDVGPAIKRAIEVVKKGEPALN